MIVAARVAILAFMMAPVPFGSVDIGWVVAWIVVLSAGLAFAPLRNPERDAYGVVAATVSVLVLIGAHSLLHVWPHVPGLDPDPAWTLVEEIDPSAVSRSSATRSEPLLALGPVLLAALAFLNGYVHGRRPGRAESILVFIGSAGAAIAVYGIVSTLSGANVILWREKTAYVENVTGTFVNRNTAATYFGTCSIIWLVWTFSRIERLLATRKHFSRIDEWLAQRDMRQVYGGLAALAICLVAVIMTRSRGGLLASGAGLAAVTVVYWRRVLFRISLARVTAGSAVLVVVAAEVFGGIFLSRVNADGQSDPIRSATYNAILGMIADHPLLGIGLGNFEALFPRFRPDTALVPGVISKAHSTWLELMLTLGLPLGALVLGCAAWIAVALAGGSLRRRRFRHVPLTALGVAIVASVHAAVDFSWQIPGYAVPFAAVIGCGLAQRKRDMSEATAGTGAS